MTEYEGKSWSVPCCSVFLTHAYPDHIASLPLMIDAVADRRHKPLTVCSTQAVLSILRKHVFNWEIWPDFSKVPNVDEPFMRYQAIELGQVTCLDGRSISVLPAEHPVPAVGYHLDSGTSSLVFSGDMGICPPSGMPSIPLPTLNT